MYYQTFNQSIIVGDSLNENKNDLILVLHWKIFKDWSQKTLENLTFDVKFAFDKSE